ncbi:diguanylate cyclase (GGDEF)-like protein [Marinimicrobium koreense]|uniref:diguanylate cyclase n=1 Tax=Marinimicrobium koreense TaxID=306545 RepID=A0A3N1NSC3_9GAMM|nr:GGDEF domain-containing protein [Marinimicrobium koreense]ROQ21752.1 diguanylate cyclase (GGDEF)-like protein [Marinimicrobium koreense]
MPQQSTLIGKVLLVWALVTLGLVGAYDYLPAKTWQWIPTDNPEWYLYSEDIFGGASYAERASPSDIHLRCKLQTPRIDLEPFCGLHIILDGRADPPLVDLSDYDLMRVDVDYQGANKKLRFFIREFEPGFSSMQEPVDSSKYMSMYVSVDETTDTIEINLSEFTVADWWVNNNNVPRKHAQGSIERVAAFGIDIAFPAALGYHELRIRRVVFEGDWVSEEHWYRYILISWAVVILLAGAVRLYQLRRVATHLKAQKEQYQQLSEVDQLTGVMNRHGLSAYFEVVKADPTAWPVSVLFIDIDHFKPINDNYGHGVGDVILRRVSETLAHCCRERDQIARWGGEEFLMALPGTDLEAATRVAERARVQVAQLVHPELEREQATVSIGVATASLPGELEMTLDRADASLYRAKRQGRNRVIRFE